MPLNTGIVPLYHLTEGLTHKVLYKAILTALAQYAHGIDDELPPEIIQKRGLISKQQAITLIHKPDTLQNAEKARQTLAYEELYHLQYAIAQRAFRHRGYIPSEKITGETEPAATESQISSSLFRSSLSPLQRELMDKLPFDLTPDQQKVIFQMNSEIDMGFTQRYKHQETASGRTDDSIRVNPETTAAVRIRGCRLPAP